MEYRSITTTQLYAKITNQKVKEEMKVLSNRIENKYELLEDDTPEFTHNQYFCDKKMGRVVYAEKRNGKVMVKEK